MRSILLAAMTAFTLVAVLGCAKRGAEPAPALSAATRSEEPAAEKAPDLLPLQVGNRWELVADDGARLVWEVVEPGADDDVEEGDSVIATVLELPDADPLADRMVLRADQDWLWVRRLPIPGYTLEQPVGPAGGVRFLPRSTGTTNTWSKQRDQGPEDAGFQRATFSLTGPWTTRVGDGRLTGRTLTILTLYGVGVEDPTASVRLAYKFVDGVGLVYAHILVEDEDGKFADVLGPFPADSTLRLATARVGERDIVDFAMDAESEPPGESKSAAGSSEPDRA